MVYAKARPVKKHNVNFAGKLVYIIQFSWSHSLFALPSGKNCVGMYTMAAVIFIHFFCVFNKIIAVHPFLIYRIRLSGIY